MQTHQYVFYGLCFAICAYALVRGGAPERLVAGALIVAGLLTPFVQSAARTLYHNVEMGILSVDLALLGVLLAIALASARYWPLLMVSLHGQGLLAHLVRPLAPDVLPAAYYVIVAWWGYPMLLLLAFATFHHRRRLRRYGVDYAWSFQLPATYRAGQPVEIPDRASLR